MMRRMQIYLPEDMFLSLKQMAKIEDIPMVEIIRKSLQKVLPRKKTKKKGFDPFKDFVGQGPAGKKTDAVKEIQAFYQK